MHLLLELAHFDVDDFARSPSGAENRWDGQRINVRSKSDSAANLCRRCHNLLHRQHSSAESQTGGGREATSEKATSAQHRIQPRLDGIFARGGFIRVFNLFVAICLFRKNTSLTLLRHDEGADSASGQIE